MFWKQSQICRSSAVVGSEGRGGDLGVFGLDWRGRPYYETVHGSAQIHLRRTHRRGVVGLYYLQRDVAGGGAAIDIHKGTKLPGHQQ